MNAKEETTSTELSSLHLICKNGFFGRPLMVVGRKIYTVAKKRVRIQKEQGYSCVVT